MPDGIEPTGITDFTSIRTPPGFSRPTMRSGRRLQELRMRHREDEAVEVGELIGLAEGDPVLAQRVVRIAHRVVDERIDPVLTELPHDVRHPAVAQV